jgi:Protein of unknown function (DUF3306)
MVERRVAEPGGFLARWSRLKQAARKAQAPAAPEPQAPPPEPAAQDLPAIEELNADSDFTAFMRPGVPDSLRNAALRKLWSSDPVYANLDGLVEYGEDFAADFNAGAAVATLYRVLEGMPGGDPPATAEGPTPNAADEAAPQGERAEETDGPPSAAAGRAVADDLG